jgi:transposase
VGTETKESLVVEGLLAAGVSVWSVNPKQLDRFRDRFSPAGAKDDRRDAWVLADSLRTDPGRFREVQADPAERIALRHLLRHGVRLRRQRRRAANQLRSQLVRIWPEVLDLEPGADARWLWALLEQVPTPQHAAGYSSQRLGRLLRRYRIRRWSPAEVLTVLRSATTPVAAARLQVVAQEIHDLCAQLRLLEQQGRRCRARLEAIVHALQQGPATDPPSPAAILDSFPGVGSQVSAAFLAQAGEVLDRADYAQLRLRSGAAPVTRCSGQRHWVGRRWACDPWLRDALHHWSDNARKRDPWAHQRYQQLRDRGCTHGRALRQLGDALLRRLAACLRNHTLYQVQTIQPITPNS